MKHKFKFWIRTSRQFHKESEYIINYTGTNISEDIVKDELEQWCENVFPMFHFTDSRISYGYEEMNKRTVVVT